MSDLIPIEDVDAVALFSEGDALDTLLERIKAEATSLVPDLTTAASRKEIASMAYKVSRSKVVIDNAGKDLTVDLKARARAVDEKRKLARDTLDELRDRVRAPLTEWEEAEKRREEEERIRREIEAAHERAIEEDALWEREREIRERERRIQEAEREAAEKAAREERLRRAREQEERERELIRAEERERAEREAREKRAREEEWLRREREAQEAAERREREAREREAARREHRANVRAEVIEAFADALDESDNEAVAAIVEAIDDGLIPHVRIDYEGALRETESRAA